MTGSVGNGQLAGESLAERPVRRRTGGHDAAVEAGVHRLLGVGLELMRADPAGNSPIADIVCRARVSLTPVAARFAAKLTSWPLSPMTEHDGWPPTCCDHHAAIPDPVDEIRRCMVAVFDQAADPDVAGVTRAVLRQVRPRSCEES